MTNKVGAKEKVAKLRARRKEKAAQIKSDLKQALSKGKQSSPNTVSENRLKLLVTIVARNKAEFYIDLLQSFDVNMQMVALGRGTADAKMVAYFGLGDLEKAVIFGVIQENKIPDALAALDEKFRTIKNGKGIAYTVPLSGVIGTLIFGFLSNNRMAVKQGKE